MEKNPISKSWHIETKIYTETKDAFLIKMREADIDSGRFLVWMLDMWVKSETDGIDSVSTSVRHLIALMPMHNAYRGWKFVDSIICIKHDCGEKRHVWIDKIRNTARKSSYKIATNVIRCIVYAIILAPSDLINKLRNERISKKIGALKLNNKSLNVPIKPDVYKKIEGIYQMRPIVILRKILDVLLSDSEMSTLIIQHIPTHPTIVHKKRSETEIRFTMSNDLYRIKVLDFMDKHKITSRYHMIYILIDIALILPDVINLESFLDKTDMVQDNDTYEQDTYGHTAAKYYKYTGL